MVNEKLTCRVKELQSKKRGFTPLRAPLLRASTAFFRMMTDQAVFVLLLATLPV